MQNQLSLCKVCGEPMPDTEQMFNFHGYSGPCPKPPLPRKMTEVERLTAQLKIAEEALELISTCRKRGFTSDETPDDALQALSEIQAMREKEE